MCRVELNTDGMGAGISYMQVGYEPQGVTYRFDVCVREPHAGRMSRRMPQAGKCCPIESQMQVGWELQTAVIRQVTS